MAGKGGGAWKVAYADFVTAMMAFFMVMWLLSQDQKVKDAVASHFRNPYGKYAIGDSLLPPTHDMYFKENLINGQNARPAPESTGPRTRKPYTLLLQRGERSIVGAVIMLPDHASELDETAREQLRGLVQLVSGKPQKIEIRGHTRRLPGSADTGQDPWQLSYERCISTMNFLIDQGIPPERIRLSQAGAYEPYTLSSEPGQAARNSRIEVFMLNEVAADGFGTHEERERKFRDDEPGAETPAADQATGH